MDFCGDRLYVVDSVAQEIHSHRNDADKKDGIAIFTARANDPLESPLTVANKIQEARDLNRKYGLGGADIGEIETVFYADWAWDEGREFLILVGDKYGQNLADQRELEFLNSYEFTMELICRRAMSSDEGLLVVRAIFGHNFDESVYRQDLEQRCPEAAS